MVHIGSSTRKAIAAVVIGSCIVSSFFDLTDFLWSTVAEQEPSSSLRRGLQVEEAALAENYGAAPPAVVMQKVSGASSYFGVPDVYPWATRNALPASAAPDPSKETVLFWNIPMAGGPIAKDYFRCLGRTIDVQTSEQQILKSKEFGLVKSGQADVIFSSSPDLALEHLFDPGHMARVLALFRHPVDRLVDKFYYLQVADWENTYKPEWKEMDILQWAQTVNQDHDYMVKKLAGKMLSDEATQNDLASAKKTVKQRFVVGLVDEMQESFKRINIITGTNNDTNKNHKKCMLQLFGKKGKRNPMFAANAHPRIFKKDPAWQVLAQQNELDIQLYESVVEVFQEQKKEMKQWTKLA